MPPDSPYLSVVAAARNDDHGGNMLRRLQTFVNGLTGQTKRHSVPIELVLVEWNPPGDKPPLAQALYKSVEVGHEIPPQLYRAVAEVLAYIYRLTNLRRQSRNGKSRIL